MKLSVIKDLWFDDATQQALYYLTIISLRTLSSQSCTYMYISVLNHTVISIIHIHVHLSKVVGLEIWWWQIVAFTVFLRNPNRVYAYVDACDSF
jgi:hypothetical protein